MRTARCLSSRTFSRRICPGLLGSLLGKISSVKWVGHGPGERGTSEWMASLNDSGEPLSLARGRLGG